MSLPRRSTRKSLPRSSASSASWLKPALPVIVTHEVEVARKTASRVVYMENGHIVEQGMPPASRIRKLTRLKLSFTLMFSGNDDEKVLIAALLAGMSLSASAAQTIRFATEASYPPFELVDANNQIVGFDVDLANALCKDRRHLYLHQSGL